MALNNVANTPLVSNLYLALSRVGATAKAVPVKYWRMIAMALILIWICNSLILIIWSLVPAPQLPVPKAVANSGVTKSSTSGPSIDLAALQALNLLGDYNAEADEPQNTATPEVTDEPLARTKLNLELQGIIEGRHGGASWAIIGRAEAQKLYGVGDKVDGANGVKISKVKSTKVILNNNGVLEELWLYGKDGKDFGSPTPSRPTPAPTVAREDEPKRVEVDADDVMSVKSIGDVVRFMVATEDGKMIGYKVRPGRKRKLFDQVGLKSDDIVVSVNGIQVNEPQKVREVYQALKNATEADLVIMRDGNTHSINISMSPEG